VDVALCSTTSYQQEQLRHGNVCRGRYARIVIALYTANLACGYPHASTLVALSPLTMSDQIGANSYDNKCSSRSRERCRLIKSTIAKLELGADAVRFAIGCEIRATKILQVSLGLLRPAHLVGDQRRYVTKGRVGCTLVCFCVFTASLPSSCVCIGCEQL